MPKSDQGRGASDTLVVVVHGLGGSPEAMCGVIAAAHATLGQIDVFVPRMPYAGWGLLTHARPADAVSLVLDGIDARWRQRVEQLGKGYARIFLIGHSIGGLIQRKVLVVANGETADAPFEPGYERFSEARPWAGRIARLVMLAGMAKGWSLTSASSRVEGFRWAVGMVLGTLTGAGRAIVMESRRGLPFVVQTRLQWLALARRTDRPRLEVVQILGTTDDLVAPDDMIDLAVDLDIEGGAEFALIEMPDTSHAGIVDMADPAGPANSAQTTRWRIFTHALAGPMADVQASREAIAPALLADGSRAKPDPSVTDVVFVIHGIRDKGFWTQKIARKIKEQLQHAIGPEQPRIMRSMTASYGYLAMLPFVWVGVRRAKTAWLMDEYVECRALYPKADFHYVGHSNGTYLGARALRDYPAARFKRMVFAGSVVRPDYDWQSWCRGRGGRCTALLNYVATDDLRGRRATDRAGPLRPWRGRCPRLPSVRQGTVHAWRCTGAARQLW